MLFCPRSVFIEPTHDKICFGHDKFDLFSVQDALEEEKKHVRMVTVRMLSVYSSIIEVSTLE